MIQIKLSDLLIDRNMSQAQLHELTGIRPGTINAYYHSFAKRLNVKDLDNICTVLNCEIGDLLEHKKKPD